MSSLLLREHGLGLHELYRPPACPNCTPDSLVGVQVVEMPAPIVPSRPSHVDGFVSLGEAIQRLRDPRTGAFFGDGQPPDAEAPETPDGDPWCDTCRGARFVAIRADRTPTTYAPCPHCARAPWRIAKQYERLKLTVPAHFRACRLDTYPQATQDQRDLVAKLRRWLDSPGRPWLFLTGPTGRGKTGLGVALLFALADRGYSPAFSIMVDLLATIKATFGGPDGDTEASILDVLYGADVFVLDDLGSEYHRSAEDWTSEKIFQLIAGRHAADKRTIITTNLSLEQLQRKLGHPRTVRRIIEATTSEWMIDFRGLPLLENSV